MILDNIGEAIITHTDTGIKYINKAGLKIVNHSISLLENE